MQQKTLFNFKKEEPSSNKKNDKSNNKRKNLPWIEK